MSKQMLQAVMIAATLVIIEDGIRTLATGEEDQRLVENIKQYGILQAMGVRPVEGGRYKVVWGNRRLRCAIAAGLTEVPAVILDKDMTEEEYLALEVIENVLRADLCGYDLWQGCVRLMAGNKLQKDVARILCVSDKTISIYLSPSKTTPEFQDALKAGKVTLKDCVKASQLPDAESQNALLQRLTGSGKAEVKEEPGPAQPADMVKTSRFTIPLPNGGQITVKAADMNIFALIDYMTGIVEAARKAVKDSHDILSFERVSRNRSKAGA